MLDQCKINKHFPSTNSLPLATTVFWSLSKVVIKQIIIRPDFIAIFMGFK